MLAAGRAGGVSGRARQPPASAGAAPSRPASRVSVGSRRRSSSGRGASSGWIRPPDHRGEARRAARTLAGSAVSPNSSLRARPTGRRRGPPVKAATAAAASSSRHGRAAKASRSRSKPERAQPVAMRARGSASGWASRVANRASAPLAMLLERAWGEVVSRWAAAMRVSPASSLRRSSRRPAARASNRSSCGVALMMRLRNASAGGGRATAASPGPGPSRRGAGRGRCCRGARPARRPRR